MAGIAPYPWVTPPPMHLSQQQQQQVMQLQQQQQLMSQQMLYQQQLLYQQKQLQQQQKQALARAQAQAHLRQQQQQQQSIPVMATVISSPPPPPPPMLTRFPIPIQQSYTIPDRPPMSVLSQEAIATGASVLPSQLPKHLFEFIDKQCIKESKEGVLCDDPKWRYNNNVCSEMCQQRYPLPHDYKEERSAPIIPNNIELQTAQAEGDEYYSWVLYSSTWMYIILEARKPILNLWTLRIKIVVTNNSMLTVEQLLSDTHWPTLARRHSNDSEIDMDPPISTSISTSNFMPTATHKMIRRFFPNLTKVSNKNKMNEVSRFESTIKVPTSSMHLLFCDICTGVSIWGPTIVTLWDKKQIVIQSEESTVHYNTQQYLLASKDHPSDAFFMHMHKEIDSRANINIHRVDSVSQRFSLSWSNSHSLNQSLSNTVKMIVEVKPCCGFVVNILFNESNSKLKASVDTASSYLKLFCRTRYQKRYLLPPMKERDLVISPLTMDVFTAEGTSTMRTFILMITARLLSSPKFLMPTFNDNEQIEIKSKSPLHLLSDAVALASRTDNNKQIMASAISTPTSSPGLSVVSSSKFSKKMNSNDEDEEEDEDDRQFAATAAESLRRSVRSITKASNTIPKNADETNTNISDSDSDSNESDKDGNYIPPRSLYTSLHNNKNINNGNSNNRNDNSYGNNNSRVSGKRMPNNNIQNMNQSED